MNRRIGLILWCCSILLAGCAGAAPLSATYRADGVQGASAIVRFRIPGGAEQQESVTLPWTRAVTYTPGQTLELTVDNIDRAAQVGCAILIDGRDAPLVTTDHVDQAVCTVTPGAP